MRAEVSSMLQLILSMVWKLKKVLPDSSAVWIWVMKWVVVAVFL